MFTPGTIAVVSGSLTRYPDFAKCLMGLDYPPGTRLVWKAGANIAENRNRCVREMAGDWIWFIDDDHTFFPDILRRLLAHPGDIVVPNVLHRNYPHGPVVYDGPGLSEGAKRCHFLRDRESGLIEVEAAGTGGMLIQRYVLEVVKDPWFENGQIRTDGLGEDLHFCQKARAARFHIYCDLDTTMGHLTTMEVIPVKHEGQWFTGIRQGQRTHLVDKAWPPWWKEGEEEGSLEPPPGFKGE